MDERTNRSDAAKETLDTLATLNDDVINGTASQQVRGDRGRHLDVQALREVMYALHAVSIGTHQLLYFSAMKYVKNHFDVTAATPEKAIEQLATVFDRMNIGTLELGERTDNGFMIELVDNALTFEDATTDKPICYFVSGYIAGYLENALDKSFVVNEISCISQGNDSCTFKAQPK